MRVRNAVMIHQIEDKADKVGRGSVWRACLAVQRSCENEALGDLVGELAYGYCVGRDSVLNHLKQICEDHRDSDGEFRQAIAALENAIDMAPKAKVVTGVDTREELWLRLDREISNQ